MIVICNEELILIGYENEVVLLELDEGILSVKCSMSTNYPVTCIGARMDLMVIGSGDKGIIYRWICESKIWKNIGQFDVTSGIITAIEYSSDMRWLALGYSNGGIDLYNDEYQLVRRFRYHNARISALSWNSDSRMLASGSLDNDIVIWRPDNSKNRPVLVISRAHLEYITGLGFIENTLISTGSDGCIKSWCL
jgi:WD40 repeat protein